MHGKIGVKTGKTGDKVFLPYADRSLGGILAMVIGRHELEINVLLAHELLERLRTFVVQFLELGFQSSIS